MYERFTDRARKVFQLANQEAQRMNHVEVGVGHLLIALAKEGSGVGSRVMQEMIGLPQLRRVVEKLAPPGPDFITMGKLPQTQAVKDGVAAMIEEAEALNHNYVGTEHIALGLVRDGSEAATILAALDPPFLPQTIRDAVMHYLGPTKGEPEPNSVLAELFMARAALDRAIMALTGMEARTWSVSVTAQKQPGPTTTG